jgi:hypothetical protein
VEAGDWRFVVYKPSAGKGQGSYRGELTVLFDEGGAQESVLVAPIEIPAGSDYSSLRFRFSGGKLIPEPK